MGTDHNGKRLWISVFGKPGQNVAFSVWCTVRIDYMHI